jgi:hypothetical protein
MKLRVLEIGSVADNESFMRLSIDKRSIGGMESER